MYACRPTIARIFQLNGNKFETTQDIDLKFSVFAHHMSGVNWQKKFCHRSISGSVAPPSMQKLWTPLATIFVEKKNWKKFWCGFRPIRVTPWKEFLIFWKKWRFEIFWTSAESRASDPWLYCLWQVSLNPRFHSIGLEITQPLRLNYKVHLNHPW